MHRSNAVAESGSEGRGEGTGEGVLAPVVNSLLQGSISVLDKWIRSCGCQSQHGCRVCRWQLLCASGSATAQCPDGRAGRIVGVTRCGVSWGTPRGSLPCREQWRPEGTIPGSVPGCLGQLQCQELGTEGEMDRHPVPLALAVAVSWTNARSSHADLSISPAPQCPSQFPQLLLIGAT